MSDDMDISPEAITEKLKSKGLLDEPVKEEKESEDAVRQEKEEEVENEEEVVATEQSEELSDVEQEAKEKGWKPDGPKSAEEFLRAEPLYEEIKQRGKEIKALRSQMDELMKHMSGLKKAGYEERMEAIKAEREEAIIRSDVESVNYYDEELQSLRDEAKEDVKTNEVHPAAQEFVEKYKDVFQDYSLEASEIKKFINDRDVELAGFNLPPEVHIQTLEKDLAVKFPEKFGKKEPVKKETVSAVESDSRPVTTKKRNKFAFKDLTSDQKKIYKHMEKRGVMSGEEYIKQLVDLGELK